MTTISAPPEADIASDFEAAGAFLRANPDLSRRIPARNINIPLKGTTTEERLAELEAIAREMGTAVVPRDGMQVAAVKFGRVTFEAHHSPSSFLIVQGAQRKAAA